MDLQLVAIDKEIAKQNYLWRKEPASIAYNPHKNLSEEELWEINLKEGKDLSDFRVHKTIRLFATLAGEPVGCVSIKNINLMMLTAEIGYVIGEKFYGRGLGTQMVHLFLKEVFDNTTLRRIEAIVNINNTASVKLCEKLGFKNEGLLREHYILNGQPADNYILGLLKKDFISLGL